MKTAVNKVNSVEAAPSSDKKARPHVTIRGLTKVFGTARIYENFDLDIPQNKFTAVFGPNGCGKSTLINMIADLIKPDAGEILIDGQYVHDVRFGYVFQNYREALFLDEPFSALDYEMTLFMRDQLQKVFMETGTTMVLVSHDLEEAIYLADYILLLSRGPAEVADFVPFDLARPRRADSLIDPDFVKTKAHCLEIFQREVRKG